MKPLHLSCALVAVFCAASIGQAQKRTDPDTAPLRALPPGSRIAVVARASAGGANVDRAVVDMLTTALRKAGVRVVERQELDAITAEQRIAAETSPDQRPRLAGADYLLSARATEFGIKDDRIGGVIGLGPVGGLQVRTSTARVVLDVRLIDTRTGSVVVTDTAQGREVTHGGTLIGGSISHSHIDIGAIDITSKDWSESALGKASRKAVDALMKRLLGAKITPEGSVLAVIPGGEVIVDVGAFDGLHEGDRLDLLRQDRVTDSKGVVVWVDERRIGEVVVTDIRGDRARARLDGPGDVREGDRVRLRPNEPDREKQTDERRSRGRA